MDVFVDLAAETERLEAILLQLAPGDWRAPSAAEGWSISDVVLHLAQTEEAVVFSLSPASFALPTTSSSTAWNRNGEARSIDQEADDAVRSESHQGWEVILDRWRRARRQALSALRSADPAVTYPWAAAPLKPKTMATTRLAEHWAHGLDITQPLCIDLPDTMRLCHVAWLAHRTLGYAFEVAGQQGGEVHCELVAPDGTTLHLGNKDSPSRVEGSVGDFCRVGARRLSPENSDLLATGPDGASVLRVLRNYAA